MTGAFRFFLPAFMLVLAACASSPAPQPDMRELLASNAVKYGSGQDEIRQIFGEPENRSRLPAPSGESSSGLPMAHEMWVYSWVEPEGESGDTRHKTLIFNFDRDGRVIDYTVSDNTL